MMLPVYVILLAAWRRRRLCVVSTGAMASLEGSASILEAVSCIRGNTGAVEGTTTGLISMSCIRGNVAKIEGIRYNQACN